MSEELLQMVEEREVKGNRERERYTQLNAEFQRIVRRDKKALLSEQCKEIEGKNRMERLDRDLFNKTGNTKGTFHAKMGTIKDRNSRKDYGDKNIQNYTKKVLMTWITMMVWSLT